MAEWCTRKSVSRSIMLQDVHSESRLTFAAPWETPRDWLCLQSLECTMRRVNSTWTTLWLSVGLVNCIGSTRAEARLSRLEIFLLSGKSPETKRQKVFAPVRRCGRPRELEKSEDTSSRASAGRP